MTATGSTWSRRLAFRSMAISFVAIFAAITVQMTALVNLIALTKDLGLPPTASTEWVRTASRILPAFPVPAIILGGLAMAIRSLRPLLAILSALAALAGVAVIVATLALAMVPLYSVPIDPALSEALKALSATPRSVQAAPNTPPTPPKPTPFPPVFLPSK